MSEAEAPKFEEDLLKDRSESEQLLLYLGDFDGPIDMLLTLARDQKVDLTKISILALANQYIDFIEKARELRLELAADYLVMAAWLAYLKSRLLIPQEEKLQAEPSAQDLADALQFQLRRLEAMRKVANDLFHLPRLGYNVFSRGEPEGLKTDYIARYEMTFYDLLKSYGDIKQRQQNSVYKLNPVKLFSLEDAIERMEHMLGKIPQEWVSLFMFLPSTTTDKIVRRSAVASTFGGALEMAKRGLIEIQQDKNYAPIYIRRPGEKSAEAIAPEALPVEESIDRDDLAFAEQDMAEEAAAEETALVPAPTDADDVVDVIQTTEEADTSEAVAEDSDMEAPAAPVALTEEEEWALLLAEEEAQSTAQPTAEDTLNKTTPQEEA